MNADAFLYDDMPVERLAGFGFPGPVVECVAAAGVTRLLPLQARALSESGLLRGRNVVVLGPTSAGKTLVGELAALRQWHKGRKAVFLCPTRALADEQHRMLRDRYAALGIRVAVSTADNSADDGRIRRGDFDFVVMVYEKLRMFLVSGADLVYSVGVVVADELQILSDPERGDVADILLTRLGRMDVQVVGLSAVVDRGEVLAQWLDADLVASASRPVDLREGVFCREHGVFHYRAAQGQWADEKLDADVRGGDAVEGVPGLAGLMQLAVELARTGENCLVFVPTRALSRQVCAAIAGELGVGDDRCAGAWNELDCVEDSLGKRLLMESLPAGVAFHNSELPMELRAMVESGFNAGRIRVLVATPTLAQGVNLRSKNVLQLPLMLRGDGANSAAHRPARVPLSVERYRNQAGRAGRMGSGEAFGRSILYAGSHLEAVRLSRAYVQAEAEGLTRVFTDENIDHFVLDCVNGGAADTYSGIHAALKDTFAWHCGAVADDAGLDDRLGERIRMLLELEMLDQTGGHRLRLTGLGQAMAAGGFDAYTIREMLEFCEAWKDHAPGDFEILCACAFTPDGEAFPASPTAAELKQNTWAKAAWECVDGGGSAQLTRVMSPRGGLSRTGNLALKLAVTCHGWTSNRATVELEEELRIVAGTMAVMASHLAWLCGGLASCAAAVECGDDVVRRIQDVARRLPLGLSADAARLSHLQVAGLSRQYLNRLAAEGFQTAAALRDADDDALGAVLPGHLRERLRAFLASRFTGDESDDGFLPTGTARVAAANVLYPKVDDQKLAGVFEKPAADHDLVIDRANPGCVVFYGRRVRVAPKPYALLCLLAQRPGETVPYTTIDEVVWPDEKVEPQQISAHKSRLIRELGEATSREKAEDAIVTDARFGLRLNLAARRVLLRNGTKDAA